MAVAIYGFGSTVDGQLGVGGVDEERILRPVLVKSFSPVLPLRAVVCGAQHSLAISSQDNRVYSCGCNDYGQLGRDGPRKKPVAIEAFPRMQIRSVSCGAAHSLALNSQGQLFVWGSNTFGQLGVAPQVKCGSFTAIPTQVSQVTEVVSAVCGGHHTLALQADGSLFSWGLNLHGQLGLGTRMNESRPQPVVSLVGVPLRRLAAGNAHSVVLSVSGVIFAFGHNEFGQLGVGSFEDSTHPAHVKQLRYQKVADVRCGNDHTTALTCDGKVFTFGAGMYGQLGHGSSNNEWLPRQVTELMGCRVSRVSCGRCHTLVLIGTRMFGFGLGASGQLGLGVGNRLLPTRIEILSDASTNGGRRLDVVDVYAGGDHSFAQSVDDIDVASPWFEAEYLTVPIGHFTAPMLERLVSDPQEILNMIESVVSSSACINASFLKTGVGHFGVNKANHGIDLDGVMSGFEALSQRLGNSSEMASRLILRSLEQNLFAELPPSPPDMEALRVYLILPFLHVFDDCCCITDGKAKWETLHLTYLRCLTKLSENALTCLDGWWSTLKTRHFNRILKVWRSLVSGIVSYADYGSSNVPKSVAANRDSAIKLALDVMARLSNINKLEQVVSFESFYVHPLAEKINIPMEYIRAINSGALNFYIPLIKKAKVDRSDLNKGGFSFMKYPFIFNASAKTLLLRTDAQYEMHRSVNNAQMWNFQSLFDPSMEPMAHLLFLNVTRQNIVEDTINQLIGLDWRDLKKPMKVTIIGEEADDIGGVQKEFFMLLFRELLNPKYGMFVEFVETRHIWFSGHELEHPQMFALVGILVGLAIYNGVLVDLPFPLALYKKLLDVRTQLDDLKEFSPMEAKSLESLLDYDGDDFEDTFCLSFEVSVPFFDTTKLIELKPNGHNVAVTKESRKEYVDLYVDYKLNRSVGPQFSAFRNGFTRVLTSKVLELFQPMELQEMAVGNEQYDWEVFERNTEYRGDYWRKQETIQMFWDVFHSFTLPEKKKFLLFLTGSDRVPLLGMKEIKMVIQPTNDEHHLPVAHTCFNLLDLPKYKDKQTLEQKLLLAIEHTEGFTLV